MSFLRVKGRSLPRHQEYKEDAMMKPKFTLFPKLPFEIRLKIWRSTLPGPRKVGIEGADVVGGGGDGWLAGDDIPPPVALQICHESREEALRYYVLSFGTNVHPPKIYFNYEIDTLCVGDMSYDYLRAGQPLSSAIEHTKAITGKSVRFVLLDVDDSDCYFPGPSSYWEDIRCFEGLEELFVLSLDLESVLVEQMDRHRGAMNEFAEANPEWVAPKIIFVSHSGRELGTIQPGQETS